MVLINALNHSLNHYQRPSAFRRMSIRLLTAYSPSMEDSHNLLNYAHQFFNICLYNQGNNTCTNWQLFLSSVVVALSQWSSHQSAGNSKNTSGNCGYNHIFCSLVVPQATVTWENPTPVRIWPTLWRGSNDTMKAAAGNGRPTNYCSWAAEEQRWRWRCSVWSERWCIDVRRSTQWTKILLMNNNNVGGWRGVLTSID